MELADRILLELQKNEVKPKAKSFVVLSRILVWFGFSLTIFSGAIAASLLFLSFHGFDSQERGLGFGQVTLSGLPIVLGVSVLLFLLAGYYLYRNTTYGYRRRTSTILAFMLLLSTVLGFTLHITNASFHTHRFLMQHVKPYQAWMFENQKSLWSVPSDGRLAGIILEVEWDYLLIQDFQGKQWQIDDTEASWRIPDMRKAGSTVKLIGKLHSGNHFEALVVLPWRTTNSIGQKGHQMLPMHP